MKPTYLGDNIAYLRRRLGISQEQFATRLGVSRQAVSKWETNEAYPETENLIAIAKLFNVSLDDLVNCPNIEKLFNQQETPEPPPAPVDAEVSTPETSATVEESSPNSLDKPNNNFTTFLKTLPYPIVITIAYLLWGFLTERGWEIGWTLYITIPVYYSIFNVVKHKDMAQFVFPVFVTFIYLLLGMVFGFWHPHWLMFLTIPIYYSLVPWLNKLIRKQ